LRASPKIWDNLHEFVTNDIIILNLGVYHRIELLFHGHQLILCHLLRKGFLSIFADITDAGGSVAVEQEGENLANKVVVNLAALNVLVAFGTSMKTFLLTALANLAP
jgi:hypothetical protein